MVANPSAQSHLVQVPLAVAQVGLAVTVRGGQTIVVTRLQFQNVISIHVCNINRCVAMLSFLLSFAIVFG